MAKEEMKMKKYKLVAQFRDNDHAWPVVIGSDYETIKDAAAAGYRIIRQYDGGFPHVDWFRIMEAKD